jgi:hypothetical protein
MNVFEFEKQGIKFFFKNPELNKYGKLIMEYKIKGIKENEYDPDGYYYNSEFLSDRNAMSFYDVKINGKSIGGVGLPEEILKEIKNLFEQFKTERENNIIQVVNELVEGKRKIYFSIVGCDYPHYQAWIRDLPKDLDGLEQGIMTRAIKIVMGKDEYVSNPCDYLQNFVNKNVKDTLDSDFEMNLKDILQPAIEKKIEKQKANQILEKEKHSMKVEVLKQGHMQGEGEDLYAKVKITDIETGESAQFTCRNIFDFGYIVNPDFAIIKGLDPGGLLNNENWEVFEESKGWYPVRQATEFEKKAVKYLHKFPPIYSEIRM